MWLKYISFLVTLSYVSSSLRVCPTYLAYGNIFSRKCSLSDDDKDLPELATQYGYPAETHKVVTEDNYILTVFYMKHPNPIGTVLLNHFLFGSAACWVDKGNTSLAFNLFDAGYSLWLINYRGNYYSREHVYLKNTDIEFWDFSYHEMGVYDIPAIIKYVRTYSGPGKLGYVGISMGGTVAGVYCSQFPQECANNINVFALLSPGLSFAVTNAFLLQVLKTYQSEIHQITKALKIGELLVRNDTMIKVFEVCRVFPGVFLCMFVANLIAFGFGKTYPAMVPIIFYEAPAGQSVKTLIHLLQNLNRKLFTLFDYGEEENLRRYNSSIAPIYDLGKCLTKTIIICGAKDSLVPPENCLQGWDQLQSEAKAAPDVHLIQDYNHMSPLWAEDHQEKVNYVILDILKRAVNW